MRTSFPWTITPHFRRDCKTEWGDGYCRSGRLCPSSAVTQRFVGQGPCALPGVGVPGSGVRAPPYTPFTDRISQRAAAAHRRANRFPATVVPVNWGTIRAYYGRSPLRGPKGLPAAFLLGLPHKGFYLCFGILTTRKRVYKFLYANLVGYFVLLQLVLCTP